MKKDQNLPNKNINSNNSSGKPLPNYTNYSRNQSPYNSSYRGGSPEQKKSRHFSQNRYSQSNSHNNQYRNNYSRSNSNRKEFFSDASSQSNSKNRQYSNNRSRKSSYNRKRNYSQNRNRSYSNHRNQRYSNDRSRNISYNRSKYQRPNNNNYQKRSQNNSQNKNSNYDNQRRNYSQSPHRNINHYSNSQNRYRSNTQKHQRQINQVQTTEETTSDPPGFDNTEGTELQLNHNNCESSDSESDTDNTILMNMITDENDYEYVTHEQPFHSHIYENQLELLHNYYTRPINNDEQTVQEVNKINTEIDPEQTHATCSSTVHIYQNIKEELPKKKFGQFHYF